MLLDDTEEDETEVGGEQKIILSADDVMCGLRRKTEAGIILAIKSSWDKLNKYCEANRLQLNAGKTHFMTIASSQRHGHFHEKREVVFLGVSPQPPGPDVHQPSLPS